MFYQPSEGRIWDPSVIRHDGRYWMFCMYKHAGSPRWDSCWIANSADGVHWDDVGAVIEDDVTVFKMFVRRCGDRFVMDQGSFTGTKQNRLKFYESSNLTDWTHVHDTTPDTRWYNGNGRWDHMYMLPKEDGNPDAGYWGYIVATPLPGQPRSWGLAESADGLNWTVLPPPEIEWNGLPEPAGLEVGGCARVDGRYYLIAGYPGYMGNFGYAMFTFVADAPTGPFRPDVEAFRLCGVSGSAGSAGVHFLAGMCESPDGLLLTNYVDLSRGGCGGRDNNSVWFLPLRRGIVDADGHLRMGYWNGNDAAKGDRLPLHLEEMEATYPTALRSTALPSDAASVDALGSEPTLRTADGKARMCSTNSASTRPFDDCLVAAHLPTTFDLERGVVLEGMLCVDGDPRNIRRPVRAGFCIEQDATTDTAILMDVGHPSWRKTRIGPLHHDRDTGSPRFEAVDETGPGCATVTGLDAGRAHSFRLWVRRGVFELYVDDLLVQTHLTGATTGRVGFLVCNGALDLTGINAWQLTL